MDSVSSPEVFLFDDFRFDRGAGALYRNSEAEFWQAVPIGSRALDILSVLIERRREIVAKDQIVHEVWRGAAVEDSNLTVQIAALRRVLDAGRSGPSCIQTIVGRGYRFLPQVTFKEVGVSAPVSFDAIAGSGISLLPIPHTRRQLSVPTRLILALVIVAGLGPAILLTVWNSGDSRTQRSQPPRLSLVVLPFHNLGGDSEDDYLTEGITDDLTTDLSHLPQAVVVANAAARTYRGRAVDPRVIGAELGVRYILEGSVRRISDSLRVNAQLIDAGNGAQVWSDRFDEPIADLARGQDKILARLRVALGLSLVEVEAARGLRAPPAAPDAFDLVLRARAISDRPFGTESWEDKARLYQEALRVDPSSVLALTGLAEHYVGESSFGTGWANFQRWQSAKDMAARARAIAPDSDAVLAAEVLFLRYQPGACQQAIRTARKLLERFPNQSIRAYGTLAFCSVELGRPAEAIEHARMAVQLNPGHPLLYGFYRRMGIAANLAGRYEEAVEWLEHSLVLRPVRGTFANWSYKHLAAAYAHLGRMAEAHKAVEASDQAWPFGTWRMHGIEGGKPETTRMILQLQRDLRLAGAREHADEAADFGVPSDAILRNDLTGYTPTAVPGASVIHTIDLARFVEERKPVLIDPMAYFNGASIPGAIGLRHAGMGGSVTDGGQERLRRVMTALTGGALDRPIVAVGWSSECFDGRNLALRLAALGYRNVFWYRGGREAWEVAGLPVAPVADEDW